MIFINPGNVHYITSTPSATYPIFCGSAENADDAFTVGTYVTLSLVSPRELGIDNPFPNQVILNAISLYMFKPGTFLMFRYVNNMPTFTAETFAQTRFGSLRKRPDPDILRRLQKSIMAGSSFNS